MRLGSIRSLLGLTCRYSPFNPWNSYFGTMSNWYNLYLPSLSSWIQKKLREKVWNRACFGLSLQSFNSVKLLSWIYFRIYPLIDEYNNKCLEVISQAVRSWAVSQWDPRDLEAFFCSNTVWGPWRPGHLPRYIRLGEGQGRLPICCQSPCRKWSIE